MSNKNERKEKGTDKREPYRVELKDHFELDPIYRCSYIDSDKLCRNITKVFKSIFEDYRGCVFNPAGKDGCNSYISLFFYHTDCSGDGHYAVSRPSIEKYNKDDVIARMRAHDRILNNSDKYMLTEDGKDIITPLLTHNYYNGGNPKWGSIVSDFAERNTFDPYNRNVNQLTIVNFIDLTKIIEFLYGSKDEDGNVKEYYIRVSAINNGYNNDPNTKVYTLEVLEPIVPTLVNLATKIGIRNNSFII